MQTNKVRIVLRAYTAREYSEVLKVPADLSREQLVQLVNDRYQHVDGGEFMDDPEYWERGDCRHEAAMPGEQPTGEVKIVDGRFTVVDCGVATAPRCSNLDACPAQAPADSNGPISDTQRLNFLEAALQNAHHLNFHKKHFSLRQFTNYEYPVFRNLRAAIDDAMEEQWRAGGLAKP